MTKRPEQVKTARTTVRAIMRSREFARGVADVRAGRPPRFDCDSWDYERGRQWAVVAPPTMPVTLANNIINPDAIALFHRSEIP